MGGFELVNGE